ncbi:enterobactin synthase subunit EntD [Enterobacteriaceae bacterium RIT691]|nr:enterobactin synthase subunit EntD [Enterobacteriaceae bacterium RIT691]
MQTQHLTFSLAHLTVHRVDFTPDTFVDTDLLWLPHHHKLSHTGRKRKAEHLAGRIAAFHALQEHGMRCIPDIGERRQPLWPVGWHGSISHCRNSAIAVVSKQPVGIDLEDIFTPQLGDDIATGMITATEREVLDAAGLPFPLALTLAFSAKESLYKALSFAITELPGFTSAQVVAITPHHITLRVNERFAPTLAGRHYQLACCQRDQQVVTLLAETLQPR